MLSTVTSEPDDPARAGDADLADLFRTHYVELVRLASILVDDVGTCEELVQDAFVALELGRRRLRDADAAPAYLRSVVLNRARSHLRRRDRSRRANPLRPVWVQPADGVDVDDLDGRDRRRAVLAALRRLPDRQREVLALRYYLDLPEAEIARTLGISAGAVKTHAHRGLAALAQELEDQP
ncbi:MAG: sigma-70 family RNA polymerase sigma factor [Acidimicrobiales bacterium]|nr:sigma-70 family RNA polymerase sigma factor [Acidimicrobiales bacterium]